jgi:hypothetical protein
MPLRDDDLRFGEGLVDRRVVHRRSVRATAGSAGTSASARLLGKSSWICVGLPVIACSVDDAGSGSYDTTMASAASRAR